MPKDEIWNNFINQNVVVDTNSFYIYIGKMTEATGHFIVLQDVDVYDPKETSSTREQYIMNAKKFGVKKNRKSVTVQTAFVVSISRLEDVIEY
ncbi:MAG: hypothetical protein AAB019_06605 [Planctomycetota bacterium]